VSSPGKSAIYHPDAAKAVICLANVHRNHAARLTYLLHLDQMAQHTFTSRNQAQKRFELFLLCAAELAQSGYLKRVGSLQSLLRRRSNRVFKPLPSYSKVMTP
jgi:hypothetical protein